MKKLTKILAGIAIASIFTLGAAAVAGCTGGTSGGTGGTTDIKTAKGAQGFTTATAGMVISGLNGGKAAGVMAKASERLAAEVTDEETITTLNEYMALVEGLISEGNFEIASGANDNQAYPMYELKMTVTYYGLDGEKLEYQTYYNQNHLGTHTEKDDDFFDRDEEVTDYYEIEGVMIIDGAEYTAEGMFMSETEGRDTENTHRLKVTIDEAAGNYLVVEQESEAEHDGNGIEYTYTLYNGGKRAESTSFEYESERDETEIELTVKNYADRTEKTFEFEREQERGQEVIKITTEENGREREYIVRVETDENGNSQYVYYSDGDRVGHGERFGHRD